MNEEKTPLHHHLHDYFFPHERNDYRPHIFGAVSIAVVVLVVITLEMGFIVQTKVVFLGSDFLASVLPSVLADLTNVARVNNGLSSVTPNATLDSAAQAAAEDMAARGYFAHVSPDGKSPWYWLDQAGYHYSYAGQNLAVNFTDSQNVETAWLASPSHRANIMKPQYTEVGFGTANGMYQGQETTFVVEYFATPAAASTPVPTPVKTVAVTTPAPVTSVETPAVLGSETKPAPTVAPASAPAAPVQASVTVPEKPTFFTSLLTSPLTSLEIILTMLLSVIALAYAVAVLAHRKMRHPRVVLGGAFLLILISGSLLITAASVGTVGLPTDTQMASVEAALQ